MDTAFFLARAILGLGLAAHGAQKLFGWFGGRGIDGTADFFSTLGFHPARNFAIAEGLAEVAGGTLTALGFLGPVGPALMMLVMIVAIFSVHWSHGFFATNNGVELPLLYATGGFLFAIAGPGIFSLDFLLSIEGWFRPGERALALAAAAFGAIACLALRQPTRARAAEPTGGDRRRTARTGGATHLPHLR